MVVLSKIITRTGDDGSSGLVGGERRPKSDQRFEAIGAVDELNAALGLAAVSAGEAMAGLLARVQNDLFDVGADLATPEGSTGRPALRITAEQAARVESEAERLNQGLPPLTSFVLPGGTPLAAALHLCRTICRRAEREVVRLAVEKGEAVNPALAVYINRLSDLLFVAARVSNRDGGADILWVPGAGRAP